MNGPGASPASANGALVRVPQAGGPNRALTFQYNPTTLRRSFEPRVLGGSSDARGQVVRYADAPTQSLSVECQFESVDDVGSETVGGRNGVTPQIAALELMMFPALADLASAALKLDLGVIEVVPPAADGVLFVWGEQSVLPVQLTGVTVMEEFFDSQLRPIRATVGLTMRALTYSDVDPQGRVYQEIVTWQSGMQQMADLVLTTSNGGR